MPVLGITEFLVKTSITFSNTSRPIISASASGPLGAPPLTSLPDQYLAALLALPPICRLLRSSSAPIFDSRRTRRFRHFHRLLIDVAGHFQHTVDLLRSRNPANHFNQLHDRRGVKEVHAEHFIGAIRCACNLGNDNEEVFDTCLGLDGSSSSEKTVFLTSITRQSPLRLNRSLQTLQCRLRPLDGAWRHPPPLPRVDFATQTDRGSLECQQYPCRLMPLKYRAALRPSSHDKCCAIPAPMVPAPNTPIFAVRPTVFYCSFAPRSVTKNCFEAETKGKECDDSTLLMTYDCCRCPDRRALASSDLRPVSRNRFNDAANIECHGAIAFTTFSLFIRATQAPDQGGRISRRRQNRKLLHYRERQAQGARAPSRDFHSADP